MENSQKMPIILNLIAALFGALGQYYYKKGGLKLAQVSILKNWEILVGAVLFVGVMGLFIAAFKMGGKLSVTYPMYATTFVWALILGKFLDHETIQMGQIVGVFLICAGVGVVGYYGATLGR